MGKIVERTFPHDGVTRKVMEMDYVAEKEEWSIYELEDESVVKMRVTAGKIFRVLDDKGNPQFNPDGDPFFIVTHNVQIISS